MVAGDKPLHSSSTPWQHKRPDHIALRSFTHPYRDRTFWCPSRSINGWRNNSVSLAELIATSRKGVNCCTNEYLAARGDARVKDWASWVGNGNFKSDQARVQAQNGLTLTDPRPDRCLL